MGSDFARTADLCAISNFNPRSPCGERPQTKVNTDTGASISIHAPRVGSDGTTGRPDNTTRAHFNPRSPCGERLPIVLKFFFEIHFNPRSPCGERLREAGHNPGQIWRFQSTLPVWGATKHRRPHDQISIISIHAPRVGSDPRPFACSDQFPDFNPRSPCGERPFPFPPVSFASYFNPRSPCGERQQALVVFYPNFCISIHAPRVGSDLRALQAG